MYLNKTRHITGDKKMFEDKVNTKAKINLDSKLIDSVLNPNFTLATDEAFIAILEAIEKGEFKPTEVQQKLIDKIVCKSKS